MRAFILAVVLTLLAGCGGSGASSSATDPPAASAPPAPASSSPPPSAPLPVCPLSPGSNTSIATCQGCPAVDISGSFCVVPQPTPPTCPTGYNMVNGVCIAPPPPPPPPPAAVATLSVAPAVGIPGYLLTWNSVNATGCFLGSSGGLSAVALSGDELVAPAAPVAYTLLCGSPGGNAELSVTVPGSIAPPPPPPDPTCPPGAVLIGGTCQAPPTMSVQLAIAPTAVVDSSMGCPDPAGDVCTAVLSITAASSVVGDALNCYVDGSEQAVNPALGWSTDPYPGAEDGPHVISVGCRDEFGQVATAAITLNVTAPNGPPVPDSLTAAANGDGSETFTWTTTSTAGAGGCGVLQANASGLETTLAPNGTPSGSATTAFLSPSGDPYTFELVCSGSPDPGVPTITLSP